MTSQCDRGQAKDQDIDSDNGSMSEDDTTSMWRNTTLDHEPTPRNQGSCGTTQPRTVVGASGVRASGSTDRQRFIMHHALEETGTVPILPTPKELSSHARPLLLI